MKYSVDGLKVTVECDDEAELTDVQNALDELDEVYEDDDDDDE